MRDELIVSELSDERDRQDQTAEGENPLAFVVRAVWRSRYLVTLIVIVGMAAGLFHASIQPNTYRSVGKLFVRPGLRDVLTPEMALSGQSTGAIRSQDALSNVLQILKIAKVYSKVVETVGPEVILKSYDPTANDGPGTPTLTRWFHELQSALLAGNRDAGGPAPNLQLLKWRAEDQVSRGLWIEPAGRSTVLEVSYDANSPETAQQIVKAALVACEEVYRETFATSSSFDLLSKDLEKAEVRARDAETEFAQFRQKEGIYDLEAQRGALTQRIQELGVQIENDQIELIRLEAGIKHLEERKKWLLDPDAERAPSLVENPEAAGLRGVVRELRRDELEFGALWATISPESYKWRRTGLRELREEVENDLVNLEGVAENDPRLAEIDQELADLELAKVVVQKTMEERAKLKEKAENDLVPLNDLEFDLLDKEREAEQAKAAVERLSSNVQTLSPLERLDELNISNVSILSHADLPSDKIGPNRRKSLLLGAILSAMAGVALATLRSFLDPRVRHPAELAKLDAPVHEVFHRRGKAPLLQSHLPAELQAAFRDVQTEVAEFWAGLPSDRGAEKGLKIGFVTDLVSRDTTVAAGIAALGIAALGGKSVAYVSCQEAPWLLGRLKLETEKGWSDVVRGEIPVNDAMQEVAGLPNLKVLPLGRLQGVAHPLTSPEFEAIVEVLTDRFRYVIVDVPSFAERPESQVLLQIVDFAEIVLRSGRSTKEGAREIVAAVRNAGATASGVALLDPSKKYDR